MARLTIVVTDDPITGQVGFDVTPTLQSLLDRQRKYGVASLSPAETYAVIALQKMLSISAEASKIMANGGRIIVPGFDQ